MTIGEDIENITQQIIHRYNPYKLLLFGSQVNNNATAKSDIDICIVTESSNKRNLLTDMYLNIDANRPLDILLYTPDEWDGVITDSLSFAYKINRDGIVLYARH